MIGKDTTQTFAEFINKAKFSDLPQEVVEQTKDYILDSIGCTMGSYSVPEGLLIDRLGRAFGSGTGGTILPCGQKTSPAAAAFINCQLCNFIDADETLYNLCHIGGVPLFSALHAAETIGASGKDLLTAIALGYDFAQRFFLNSPLLTVNELGGTDITPTHGFGFLAIAGAVAAAKVLRLDTEGIRNAMGIAGYHTTLPLASKWTFSPPPLGALKYQDIGWFSFVGLMSALWVQEGCEADQYIMDDMGEFSFWKAFGMP